MKCIIPKGSTNVLVNVFIQDSTSTTGAGKTGLAYNTAGLTAYYHRNTAASPTAITLATMTVGTWVSGGFKEIDSTNMPGWYQIGLPDAAIAGGADFVGVHLKGATGMAPLPLEIQFSDEVIQMRVWMVDDNSGGRDLWMVTVYADGAPYTGTITSPTLQVVKEDGTNLIAATALTQIGSTGYYKLAESTNRIVSGQGYVAVVSMTINGATQTWTQQMSRDS